MKILITLIACLVIGCWKSGKTIELEAENKRLASLQTALKSGELGKFTDVLRKTGMDDYEVRATEKFLKETPMPIYQSGKETGEQGFLFGRGPKGKGTEMTAQQREASLRQYLVSPKGLEGLRGQVLSLQQGQLPKEVFWMHSMVKVLLMKLPR